MMNRTVDVAGLETVLDKFGQGCTVLSLDCFDTLIWRKVAQPIDAFHLLSEGECFRRHGLSQPIRIGSETGARRLRRTQEGLNEVSLAQIYRHALPNVPDNDIDQLVADELAMEMRVCYVFKPVLQLIERAKARGMKVIIVSDTYFNSDQLSALIGSTVGNSDASELVDAIYCSSRYGRSKHERLFNDVLKDLHVVPDSILHVGDNPGADLHGANECGLRGVQLLAFNKHLLDLKRMTPAAASIISPKVRNNMPAYDICSALWAQNTVGVDNPEFVGHTALGPIILSYMKWVVQHAIELKQAGKNPHLVFMLRDGWLPHRVYERLLRQDNRLAGIPHSEAEVSRFAGYASSFTDAPAIDRYLSTMVGSNRYQQMARQLNIPEKRAQGMIHEASHRHDGMELFRKRVMEPRILEQITGNAHAYRNRMMTYLRSRVGLKPGETAVLVDLGYAGTIQSLVQPQMEADLGITVDGAYMLLRDTNETLKDKFGWLDRNSLDWRAIESLTKPISLLEQLCTCDMDSVVDYAEDGTPIHRASTIGATQAQLRTRIQDAALQFVDAALQSDTAHLWNDSAATWYTGLAQLTRLMYLPGEVEIATFEECRHDINLGTDEEWQFFNRDEAARGLQRRGMVYMNGTDRPTLSMELQPHGIQLPLTHFLQLRYRIDLQAGDFNVSRGTLPVMFARNGNLSLDEISVQITHNGYLLALIGVDNLSTDIGIMFGKKWRLLQLDSITLVEIDKLMNCQDNDDEIDLLEYVSLEKIEQLDGSILRCNDTSAFAFAQISGRFQVPKGKRYACAVLFRPLEEQISEATAESPSSPQLALAS
ncbi:MAG: HAD hydrolase-like protein [Gammaproteobacteria bacterium]